MQTLDNFVPITQAKSKLLDMVRSIHDRDDSYAITKNGVPEAVLISMKKFEGLLETLDILSDENAMKSIKKSIKDAQQGKWLDYDEVFGE